MCGCCCFLFKMCLGGHLKDVWFTHSPAGKSIPVGKHMEVHPTISRNIMFRYKEA